MSNLRILPIALMLLVLACGSREQESFVPDKGLVGRMVQSAMGPQQLLDEPGGVRRATLPEGLPLRVVARQSDEAGIEWVQLEGDSLLGWLPKDRVRLASGQEGRIETH
jgi:hypothetical protein